jgi:STE24 endopeptidase
MTRMNEFQADEFAAVDLDMGEDLKQGLICISEDNKSSMNVDWLWGWWHLTHPTLLERLDAVDAKVAAAKKKGGGELGKLLKSAETKKKE